MRKIKQHFATCTGTSTIHAQAQHEQSRRSVIVSFDEVDEAESHQSQTTIKVYKDDEFDFAARRFAAMKQWTLQGVPARQFPHQERERLENTNAAQARPIIDLQGKLEEQKKSAAAARLELERTKECVICQENDKCVVLYPCAHFALCERCQHVEYCPMCRKKVEETKMAIL